MTRIRGFLSALRVQGADEKLKRLWIPVFAGAAGLFLAQQIIAPSRRLIQIALAAALFVTALRVPIFYSLLCLVIAIPLRKGTSYGGTTVAFVIVVFSIWMVRLGLRMERLAGRSSLDWPVAALLFCYVISFFRVASAADLRPAFFNFYIALTYICLAFFVIHFTRTERQLRTLVGTIVVMTILIHLSALYELAFPGRQLIPGWLEYLSPAKEIYVRKGLEFANIRIGGAIYDYELLAEYCAMMMFLIWFFLARARRLWHRAGFAALLFLNTFVLLITATRGALISLAVGVGYVLWALRRRLRPHVVALGIVAALLAGNAIMELLVKQTRAGNVVERLWATRMVGLVPDNRTIVWRDAWERIWDSPLFGHGPYYSSTKEGVLHTYYWPHNNYLFYWHILGIVGLGSFLWVLSQMWRDTRVADPGGDRSSYTGGLLLALRGMLVVFIVDQIKIDYLRNDVYAYLVWLFFGLIAVTARLHRQEPAWAPPSTTEERPAPPRRPARVSPAPSL